ncbi:uncharacterized protein OCT59_003757 [Rhizophagus irregularis]|nr:hypothetical protein OCT59_003757 [Rhizophagus irregularis]GBC17461.1 hypothetical protein GLOIN_2v851753 [Rhizophagus irregularis DAOM 181602=DAOM 197198]
MSKLNGDVLNLIFKVFHSDNKTLYSCLLVNKTWCEVVIPFLWKDPWKDLIGENENLLLNVIISHLSDELINNLKSQGVDFLTNSYTKPLFNYISFCKHLNLNVIERMINANIFIETSTVKNEVINLFINENTKFTHLYIPHKFNYQIHLIPGTDHCFSELEFLSCNTCITDNALNGLTEICKSIKVLELIEVVKSNYGIVKLIEAPKRLFTIRLITENCRVDEPFYKILENSFTKHANFIQDFITNKSSISNILSSFVNLKRLELRCNNFTTVATWDCLKDLSLPFLQTLKAIKIPFDVLASLIDNTNGYLNEISISYVHNDEFSNKRIIQAIYKNCPNLKYLKLLFRSSNILELENLLTRCQYLDGLFLITDMYLYNDYILFENLFEVLARSSPTNLFKFKIYINKTPKLESLKLFFDNWKGRHPMLLQTIQYNKHWDEPFDLIEKYKVEGIIKKYDHVLNESIFEDFKWIEQKF